MCVSVTVALLTEIHSDAETLHEKAWCARFAFWLFKVWRINACCQLTGLDLDLVHFCQLQLRAGRPMPFAVTAAVTVLLG